MLVLIWSAVIIGALYLYFKQHYSLFTRYGVKSYPPIPLLGNMARIVTKIDHFSDDIYRYYFDFPNERFVGRYEFMNPVVIIRDLELVKKITVKDFEHFLDHRSFVDEVNDPLFGRNLFSMKGYHLTSGGPSACSIKNKHMKSLMLSGNLTYNALPRKSRTIGTCPTMHCPAPIKLRHTYRYYASCAQSNNTGQTWKDMRSTLSPAFTSSKMKVMVPFMVDVGKQMNKALKKNIQDSGVGYIDADIKDMTSRFANDVVASCAFGLKVDSHLDLDNQFYAQGKEASQSSFRQLIVFFGYTSFPRIMRTLGISLFTKESQSFFRELVSSTMQEREIKNIIRPDMIHLLMEAKKGQLTHEDKDKDVDAGFATVEESSVGKKNVNRGWYSELVWTDDDLTAQAVLFFIAGFETVSSSMSFLLHELALNPDIQERLAQEIKDNEKKTGGKFDYTSIQSMTYLDMVVSELLRRWPAGVAMDRVCIKDYNCGRPNDKATEDFIIRKGTGISIATWGFHQDPQYFPDPEKFDPERFSEQNKHNIKPFTYMPFGLGPRNCIGSRFALCEIKVMVYQLLNEIELSPCEKTCIPSKLATDTFQLKLKGGHWLRMRARV